MATMTFNHTASVAAKTAAPAPTDVAKKSFFARLVDAISESNRRKADVHIRRAMATMDSARSKPDYSMLPFQGE
jgi:hypothetical protein